MQPEEHNIEQWLDAALKQYGAAEARPGLEARVLTQLRAEKPVAFRFRRWIPAAAAVGALAIAALWMANSGHHAARQARHTSQAAFSSGTARPSAKMATLPATTRAHSRAVQAQHGRTRLPLTMVRMERPKLRQFPSARPLTQQDKLLLEYVHHAPKEELAFVIAQQHNVADLSVGALQVAPLGPEMPAVDSHDRN
jgi:hypothetical protein